MCWKLDLKELNLNKIKIYILGNLFTCKRFCERKCCFVLVTKLFGKIS